MEMRMGANALRKWGISRVTLLLLFLTLGVGSLTLSNCLQHNGRVPQMPPALGVLSAEGIDGYSGGDVDVYRFGIQALRGRRMMAVPAHLHLHRFLSSATTSYLENPAEHSSRHNPSARSKALYREVLYSKGEHKEGRRALLSNNPDLNRDSKEIFNEDYSQPGSNRPIIEDPPNPPHRGQEEPDYEDPEVHPPTPDYWP